MLTHTRTKQLALVVNTSTCGDTKTFHSALFTRTTDLLENVEKKINLRSYTRNVGPCPKGLRCANVTAKRSHIETWLTLGGNRPISFGPIGEWDRFSIVPSATHCMLTIGPFLHKDETASTGC